ncbi:hypothetical protein CEN45_05180 [Fischerella thermalis CCMEE 5198]|uniref:hypothetical protein n=1 Tax=Fischerella thermalis TaxID=372787 RepID=UPI000C80A7B5|nr:hypothetical protein [Fischerella thermalis]PLZ85536.1 hypothetical protein CI594_22875 [Fischerella thermalis CCMEE 5196]PMB25821.1 hypothetical protein CEN45_05180 [Fischerella thermalis CCMEE 5198]
MDIQLIKVIKKPILKEVENTEEPEQQDFSSDPLDIAQENLETKEVLHLGYQDPSNIPVRDYPIVRSVGNSGWQASDIWRDIRIDNFC